MSEASGGFTGRDVTLSWNGVSVKGVQTKEVKCNDEVIDVTSGENGGRRVLLNASGQESIDISIDAVSKDRVMVQDYHAGDKIGDVEMTWPNGDTLTGKFRMSNLVEGLSHKGAGTFKCTLMSADEDYAFVAGA